MIEFEKSAVADTGLRDYMRSIYQWMVLGLLLSAGVAEWATSSGVAASVAHNLYLYLPVLIAPFALIFVMGAAVNSSVTVMRLSFFAFTAILGLWLAIAVSKYSNADIALAFAASASGFVALSVWSLVTKIDLSGYGNFFLSALVGLIVASVVSMVVHSSVFATVVNLFGVVIFSGLIAYDTQTMREAYRPGNPDANARMAISSAIGLYLDFLNLFLFILQLVGDNDD